MRLLIHNKIIVAIGIPEETELNYVYDNLVIPKTVIPGGYFVDADLPEDYLQGKYLYDNGWVLNPDWMPPEG